MKEAKHRTNRHCMLSLLRGGVRKRISTKVEHGFPYCGGRKKGAGIKVGEEYSDLSSSSQPAGKNPASRPLHHCGHPLDPVTYMTHSRAAGQQLRVLQASSSTTTTIHHPPHGQSFSAKSAAPKRHKHHLHHLREGPLEAQAPPAIGRAASL